MAPRRNELEELNLDFHEIQVHILRQLGYRNKKTFSGLQGEWDSSKVSFHVNKLLEKELIQKEGNEYKVTPKAKGVLADIKHSKRRSPINILNVVILSPDGKIFLEYSSDSMDPLAEAYRPIISRILKGEKIEDKAKELFREEFGYKPKEVEKAGVLENLLTFKEGYQQYYILHTVYIESEEENTNFYSTEEMEDINMNPGMKKILEKTSQKESLPFIGNWNLIEEEQGFELENLEF